MSEQKKTPPFAGTPNLLRNWLNDHPGQVRKCIDDFMTKCPIINFQKTATQDKLKCFLKFTELTLAVQPAVAKEFKLLFNNTFTNLVNNTPITFEQFTAFFNNKDTFKGFSKELQQPILQSILSNELLLQMISQLKAILETHEIPVARICTDLCIERIKNVIVALTILDYEWGKREKNEKFKQFLVDKYCTVVFREGVSNCTGNSITGQTPKDLKTIADQIHKYYIENILETVTPSAALTPIETKMKDNIILKSKNIKTIFQNCVAYQSYQSYLKANKLQEVTSSHKNLALNLIHLQFESVWIINMDVISVKPSDFLKENIKNTWIDYIYVFIYKSFVMKDDKTKNDSNSNAFKSLIQKYANTTYNNEIPINTEKLHLEKAYYDELYNRTMVYKNTPPYQHCKPIEGLIVIKKT